MADQIGNNGKVAVGYTANNAAASKVLRPAAGFVFYASPGQRSILSSSANDTGAGTGAQIVQYTFYDGNMNGPFTGQVTMNGVTAVNTPDTNIQFIESLQVLQVGSGGGNAGTISINSAPAGGGSSFSCIATGDNATFWAHHFISSGKRCYLFGMDIAGSLQPGSMVIFSTGDPRSTNLPQVNVSGTKRHAAGPSLPIPLAVPIIIPGPNFIFMSETPDAATVTGTNNVYGSFHCADF